MTPRGNYISYQELSERIRQKIKDGIDLHQEELQYISKVLLDPLQEFCRREATFRLIEMLDVFPDNANKLEAEAEEIIRDIIDYDEELYDNIDYELRNLIYEKSKQEN